MNTISLLNTLSNSKIVSSSIPSTIGNGLILYWSFENNSYNETITGAAPISVAGTPAISTSVYKVGSSSLSIPNGNSYLNFYNAAGFLPATTNGYSFSIWFNLNTTPAGQKTLFQFAEEVNGYNNIMIYFNGASLLLSLYRGAGSYIYNLSNGSDFGISTVSTGVWYHLVVTLPTGSGATVFPSIYLNGVNIPCPHYILHAISLTASRQLGCIGSGYNASTIVCNGFIDEFRIYNRVLNTTEISILYLGNYNTSSLSLSLSIQKSFSYGLYDYYVFSSNKSFTCNSSGTIEYMLIGGGGAGGGNHAGGGGAGGIAYESTILVSGATYTVTVGVGGTGGGVIATANAYTAANNNGGNSSIVGGLVNIIAYGGGYGGGGNTGYAYNNGTTGNTGFTTVGSGGGGMAYNQALNTATIDTRGGIGGNGVNNVLYGYAGRNGGAGFYTATAGNGGGGGGAGVVGGNASATLGGNGGNGMSSTVLTWLPTLNILGYMSSISSTWATDTVGGYYIAAGGGGGSWSQNGWQPGTGGLGGGGAGGAIGTGSGLPGSNAASYTGSGGGGGASTGNVGGNGGSGLVALRSLSPTYTSFNLTNQYITNGNTFGTIAYATTASYTATAGLTGVYNFSVSSGYNAANSFFMNMFTNNSISGTYTYLVNNGWTPSTASTNAYTSVSGLYSGTTSTTYNTSSTVLGEWLQIQLPISIILQQYSISGITDSTTNISSPALWILLGSNNGTTWTTVDDRLSSVYNYPPIVNYINQTVVSMNYLNSSYSYYRFVIKQTGGRAYPFISNFNLIGAYVSVTNLSIRNFDLTTISGLKLWLDATVTGITSTNWPDKSSNGYTATGSGMNYTSNLLSSGKSSVQITQNLITNAPFSTAPLTWFIVININNNSNYSYFSVNPNTGPPGGFQFVVSPSNQFYISQYGGVGFSSSAIQLNSSGLHFLTVQLSGSGNTYTNCLINYDGTNKVNSSANQAVYSSGTLQIFANTGFYVSELVYYQTLLTTTQIKQVEGYLAWKWGLNALLPTTHPYYSSQYGLTTTLSIISSIDTNNVVPTKPSTISWSSVSSSITNYTATVTDSSFPFFSGLYTIYSSSAASTKGVNLIFNANVNPDLLLHYPLSSITSNQTADFSSGSAVLNAATSGVTIVTTSQLNGINTMNFSATNCKVTLSSFTITNNVLSVSFWWYISSISVSTPIFCLNPTNASGFASGSLQVWSYNPGVMSIWLNSATANTNLASQVNGPATPSLNTWHHVCMVINTSNFYYYLNTTQAYTSSWSGYSIPNQTYNYNILGSDPIHVGNIGTNGGNYNIANFRVYNKVLSAAEITNLYTTKT